MPLLNIFRGKKSKAQKRSEKGGKRKTGQPAVLPKKEIKPKKVAVKEVKKEVKKEVAAKTPSTPSETPPSLERPKRRGEVKTAPKVLKFPSITEKATFLQDRGQYIFKVFSTSTKPEIKKSIEEVYGVDVVQVRVINVKGKSKRLGRSRGFQAGYKKAIVKIKVGQTIEVMPR